MSTRDASLELKIEGRSDQGQPIRARTFALAVDRLESVLVQLGRALHPGLEVEWVVKDLRMGSTAITVEPITRGRQSMPPSGMLLDEFFDTMEAFESEVSPIPAWVTASVAESVRALGGIASSGQVSIRRDDRLLVISPTSVSRAKGLLERRYHSIGSVEGKIETISQHEGSYFTLYHILDGYAIRCNCDAEQLQIAHGLFGRRVRVFGSIQRRFDGKVESIRLQSINVIPENRELPQVEDIVGILAPAKQEEA